jgi:DNA-binding LytR/AlgR family response regulator
MTGLPAHLSPFTPKSIPMAKEWLYFNSRDELLRVDVSKIMCFEADGNYTNILMTNNMRASVCMNLAAMEKMLADNLKEKATRYVRIGKRYIINLNYVYQLNVLRHKLVLSDFDTCSYSVEISKEALKKLKEIVVKLRI